MPRTKVAKAPKSSKSSTVSKKEKTSRTKTRKEPKPEPEPVTESVPESVPESTEDSGEKKKRHVPTRDSVEQEFTDLMTLIEEEISKLRESTSKSKGIKFLRTVMKNLRTTRAHALRVMKKGKGTKRKGNTNSGFLKPVRISKELAKFTGWNPKEEHSRVDVTKYICNYIKEKDLQNPEDRRQIRVDDDPKLKSLLKYDAKKDKKPLTYYSLQTYLKGHYPENSTSSDKKSVRKSKK